MRKTPASLIALAALLAVTLVGADVAQAAIARDATTRNGNAVGAAPVSWSHTTSGANRYLIVGVGDESSDGVGGVTYNGVAMTQLKKQLVTGGINVYFYGLAAPALGSNTITITAGSDNVYGFAVSYTGVAQTGQPDASAVNTSASSPVTTTLTTVADNAWTVLFQRSDGNGTASTGSTFVQAFNGTDTKDRGLYDSNAALTPAGSHSMTISYSGLGVEGTVMVSLAPAASVAAPSEPYGVVTLFGWNE